MASDTTTSSESDKKRGDKSLDAELKDFPKIPSREDAKWTNGTHSEGYVPQFEPPVEIFHIMMKNRPAGITRVVYNNIFSYTYDRDMSSKNYQGPKIMLDYIKNKLRIPVDAPLCELGCGTGQLGELLTQAGYKNVDGVDISEEMINKAKRKECYKNYYLENVQPDAELDFRGTVYDCVILCSSLLPGHISTVALPNIARLVNPAGGHLIWLSPERLFMADMAPEFEKLIMDAVYRKLREVSSVEMVEEKTVEDYYKKEKGWLCVMQKKN